MDRAVLSGADFSGTQPQSATLIGVISQEARFHRADLSGARMSGQTSFRRALRTAVSPRADLEFVLMAEARCGAPACMRPHMSGAQLDIRTEEAYLARYLWALLKGVVQQQPNDGTTIWQNSRGASQSLCRDRLLGPPAPDDTTGSLGRTGCCDRNGGPPLRAARPSARAGASPTWERRDETWLPW